MALYSICQYSIHNLELDHGCFTILIVYQSMLLFIMNCVMSMVRPDDPGMDIGLLCFQACSSVLLVHPKGGRPGDARVVTSYTGVLLGYAGSFGYTVLHGVTGVDSRRWQPCPSGVTAVLHLAYSLTFGFGVGVHAKR
jgi:hypothetical protein